MAEFSKYELIDIKGQHRWFTHIKVTLEYRKHGIRLDGERGYYLFCSPVRREYFEELGYTTEQTRSGDGISLLLTKCIKFNKRQAAVVAQECDLNKLNNKDSWFYKVVDYICRKHHLHIGECALKGGEFCVQ